MKRIIGVLLVTFVALSAIKPAYAQSDFAGQVDHYLADQMEKDHIPGVSVAVVQNGQIVFAKGYGLANVELLTPATDNTVYELMSVSKQFTATAIMMLVEQGHVALDDKINKYLPDLPDTWNAITVHQLLSHTSGIPDYVDRPDFWQGVRQDRAPDEVLKLVRDLPLNFQPGTQWHYSNSGYYVLGQIIEKVSGQRYADFLNEHIFKVLGMSSTQVNNLQALIPNRASGYIWQKNQLQNAEYVSPTQMWAAGAVNSTVTDLAKWDAALYTEKILKQSTLEQMRAPTKLNDGSEVPYGEGNELATVRGHRVAGHQGTGNAFNTTFLRYVDDQLTVIVLCNLAQAPSHDFAAHIATIYLPNLGYTNTSSIEDKSPPITAILKQVILDAQQGKSDATLFASSAQGLASFLRRGGPQLMGKLGTLQFFTLLEQRDESPHQIFVYRVTFAQGALIWTFTLDKDNKILDMNPVQE